MQTYAYADGTPLDTTDPSGEGCGFLSAICNNIGTILTGAAVGSCLVVSIADLESTAVVCIGGGALALGGRALQRYEHCIQFSWEQDLVDAVITLGTAGAGQLAEEGLEGATYLVRLIIRTHVTATETGIGSVDQYEQQQMES